MKTRAAAAIKAGVGAVALALAVSVAAPVSAQTPLASGKPSASAAKKGSAKVFRSVKVTPSRPVVGTKVTVKGRTRAAERRLVLQVRTDRGTWRKVAVKRASKNGKFSFKYAVNSAKPRSLRVVARTAPKVKRSTAHVGKGTKSSRKLKSRRVVSKVVKVVARPAAPPRVKTPAPVVPTPVVPAPVVPAPDADAVFAGAVRAAVDAGVRDHRKANGVSAAGTNQCLTQWADGFAADMARTNIFAHSVSSEWAGRGIVTNAEACLDEAPAVVRQEAIAWENGATPQEVADKVLQAWKDAWMHDEVLLDDFGHDRVLSVGVAKGDAAHGWYVVAAFGADF